jgi:putative flippase GtrA
VKLGNKDLKVKFLIAGFLSTCTQYISFFLFLSIFNINVLVATSIAYIFGSIISYIVNYYFTFNSNVSHYKSLLSFYIMVIFGGFCNASLMFIMINIFTFNLWASQIIVTAIIFVSNFFISKRFVFQRIVR